MERNIFKDESLNNVLNEQGIIQIPFLDEQEVEQVLNVFNKYENQFNKNEFYSTMFENDSNHRRIISDLLFEIIKGKIEAYFYDFEVLFTNFIIKKSSIETGVGIHQDWNYTTPDFFSFNIWIPLVDIDDTTGLFYGVPKSHLSLKNIRYTPYENMRYAFVMKYCIENKIVFAPKKGEALVYDGALIHFSDPNLSGKNRIAIASVLLPQNAPKRHYFKPDSFKKTLQVFEVDKFFYHSFDFFKAPVGYPIIEEIDDYISIPKF